MSDTRIKKVYITNLIIKSGKSMTQVAKDAGISLAHLSKISGGTRMPSVETVSKLAEVFGVSEQEVLSAIGVGWRGEVFKDEEKMTRHMIAHYIGREGEAA